MVQRGIPVSTTVHESVSQLLWPHALYSLQLAAGFRWTFVSEFVMAWQLTGFHSCDSAGHCTSHSYLVVLDGTADPTRLILILAWVVAVSRREPYEGPAMFTHSAVPLHAPSQAHKTSARKHAHILWHSQRPPSSRDPLVTRHCVQGMPESSMFRKVVCLI